LLVEKRATFWERSPGGLGEIATFLSGTSMSPGGKASDFSVGGRRFISCLAETSQNSGVIRFLSIGEGRESPYRGRANANRGAEGLCRWPLSTQGPWAERLYRDALEGAKVFDHGGSEKINEPREKRPFSKKEPAKGGRDWLKKGTIVFFRGNRRRKREGKGLSSLELHRNPNVRCKQREKTCC